MVLSQHLEEICSVSSSLQFSKPESELTNKKLISRLWPTALWAHSGNPPQTLTSGEGCSLQLWTISPGYIHRYGDTLDFAMLSISLKVSASLRRKAEDFYPFIFKFQNSFNKRDRAAITATNNTGSCLYLCFLSTSHELKHFSLLIQFLAGPVFSKAANCADRNYSWHWKTEVDATEAKHQ